MPAPHPIGAPVPIPAAASPLCGGGREPDKIAQARQLLDDQREGLEFAIRTFAADRYEVMNLNSARAELRRVARWEQELAGSPDLSAALVLGFMGRNGRAPAIQLLIRQANSLAAAVDHERNVIAINRQCNIRRTRHGLRSGR